MFLSFQSVSTRNVIYDRHYFSSIFFDKRIPVDASSPGWQKYPTNSKVSFNDFVHFECQNKIPHNCTVWLLNGKKNVLHTKQKHKVKIEKYGRILRYGPVQNVDNGVYISCLVCTKFGQLPSPLGMIIVKSKLLQNRVNC